MTLGGEYMLVHHTVLSTKVCSFPLQKDFFKNKQLHDFWNTIQILITKTLREYQDEVFFHGSAYIKHKKPRQPTG